MKLTHLRLSQFRNFAMQEVSLRPRLNFFLGANGQGKTNLLEAVYMLSRGESFRSGQHEHFLKDQAPRARVAAVVDSEIGRSNLVMDFAEGRTAATYDGKRTGFSTLSAQIPVVLFSPESLASIKEGPDQRRELIDSVLATRSERDSKLLREFAKILRSRNILLKQIAKGDSRQSTRDSLESLTTVFLLLATQVTETRLRILEQLEPEWKKSVAQIFVTDRKPSAMSEKQADANLLAKNQLANVHFRYEISGNDAMGWSADQIFDAFSKRLEQLGPRELQLGASLVGPHKHDLRFFFDQNDSRFYCSQGQQRALILAFKIAQISVHHTTLGRYPILLLDDVMSELDAAKRSRLMEYLEETTAQVLITATDLIWSREFREERNAVFAVENGNVTVATQSAIRAVGLGDFSKSPADPLEDAAT
ncbi:DNA replication/repair protein RecF [soil metagenome]